MGDLLEYVGATQRSSEQPGITRVPQEHVRLDGLITTKYEDVSTLAIKDRCWFRHLKEVLFTE
jgi:hypothetical protein